MVILGEMGSVTSARKTCARGLRRAGAHVLNVEDEVFATFVEDAGLDLKGDLRVFELVFEREEGGGGAGDQIERVEEAEREGGDRDERDDADEVERAHAGGAHSGDFGVGGEA